MYLDSSISSIPLHGTLDSVPNERDGDYLRASAGEYVALVGTYQGGLCEVVYAGQHPNSVAVGVRKALEKSGIDAHVVRRGSRVFIVSGAKRKVDTKALLHDFLASSEDSATLPYDEAVYYSLHYHRTRLDLPLTIRRGGQGIVLERRVG